MKKVMLSVICLLAAQNAYANDGRINPNYRYRAPSAQINTHVGQTDTDGILSPGERRNPYINYNARPNTYNNYGNYNGYAEDRYYADRIEDLRRREENLREVERQNYYGYNNSWWNW
jgi:hypothetical protein